MKGVDSILVCLSHKCIFRQSKHRNISEDQRFLLHRCDSLKSLTISVAEKPQCFDFLSREKRRLDQFQVIFQPSKNLQARSQ